MAKKKTLVNSETDKSVPDFIAAIKNKVRKADAEILVKLMEELTGFEPKIWGVSIIGYGKYPYKRKNGDEFEWFHVGFSPGKAHLSIYLTYDVNEEKELLSKLGNHKTGRGCLYIKKLANVDMEVLKQLIKKSDRWN